MELLFTLRSLDVVATTGVINRNRYIKILSTILNIILCAFGLQHKYTLSSYVFSNIDMVVYTCSIVSAFRLGQKLILMNRRRLCFRNDIDVKNGNVNLLQSFVTLPLPKCTNNFPVRKNSAMVGALMFRTNKCSRGSSSLYLWRFLGCTPIWYTTKCKLVLV